MAVEGGVGGRAGDRTVLLQLANPCHCGLEGVGSREGRGGRAGRQCIGPYWRQNVCLLHNSFFSVDAPKKQTCTSLTHYGSSLPSIVDHCLARSINLFCWETVSMCQEATNGGGFLLTVTDRHSCRGAGSACFFCVWHFKSCCTHCAMVVFEQAHRQFLSVCLQVHAAVDAYISVSLSR